MLRRRVSKQVEEEEEAKTTSEYIVDRDPACELKESDTDDSSKSQHERQKDKLLQKKKEKKKRKGARRWGCLDVCCWFIGYVCVIWWFLTVLFNAMPSALPQFVMERMFTGPLPDPPGVKLRKEGLFAKHPVVFVPGIVTGGLELWEGKPCADGLFRKRLWGGTFGEIYKRPKCWMEHMSLNNETGLDPDGIRVRPVSGLVAADYFAPGYFVWAVLIQNLAQIGYEEKNMHMAAYDWRLTFQNTEVRDKSLSRLKSTIETMVQTSAGNKVVVIPHSMGSLYFLHFLKWVEAPVPIGGGGGPDWCASHIKATMNIAGPLLGVPKAFAGLFSAEAKDIAVARAIAPGVLGNDRFGLQTLEHMMRVTRTWDACMSMMPKGGNTIWGDANWSPEEGYACMKSKFAPDEHQVSTKIKQESAVDIGPHGKPFAHYGRMVAFGKEAAVLAYSAILEKRKGSPKMGSRNGKLHLNASCGDVWTEYHELSWDDMEDVANHDVYCADDLVGLMERVAPKLMVRGEENWGFGLADDLDDPKYQHFRHWSNPLETLLPNAPEMEVFCLYGVGILTERSYIYKVSPSTDTCNIPFRIDSSADGDSEGCLKGGVQFVDGDETVPALSAGFMCYKPWKGKTRFNPASSSSYVREYNHAPPTNLLEGRGTQSGSHVDIMGNFALIEDILRVASGQSGDEIGGDRIYSDLPTWSERINLKL
ncbi:unnamed protein product [Sphagnum jensenii]|uniref:Phospholipid:diacylglycerol acyltransferase n=1 Tax=Sphagnum jensenii TaxID=128206 RepID=A0ABP0W6R7_9BRYO